MENFELKQEINFLKLENQRLSNESIQGKFAQAMVLKL
jgi:hypothetical protein